jgi:hypothetical protein
MLLSAIVAALVACDSTFPSQQVSFPTADGGTVVADFYAASSPGAVVLAHGGRRSTKRARRLSPPGSMAGAGSFRKGAGG